jgi:peptidyl-dipeptidase Dcp
MRRDLRLAFAAGSAVMLAFASMGAQEAPAASSMTDNPLLQESPLPFHYPQFDRIREEHFLPAFEESMAEELREIEAIARNPSPPTFENTVVALERSGLARARVERIFSNLNGTLTSPGMQEIEKTMAPRLAAHRDAILLNRELFERLEAVHGKRASLGLPAEGLRLVERLMEDFVRAGARLDGGQKERLKALNAEIATLQTRFAQNALKERNARAVLIENVAELDGLSENEIATAAAAAKPALASLKNRKVRQRVMEASLGRGAQGGEFDNRETLARLARLRAERAQLLGYPHHAAYRLEVQTAKDAATVNAMLARLAAPAVANAKREAGEMQEIIDAEKGGFQLAAWDWDFYAEKLRQARYAFDESQLKPYFEMNRVLVDGVFHAATRLFGITFKEREDLPKYHPDTKVYEVTDADGAPLALFIVDWYARPSKRGGAWMNSYVSQSRLLNRRPVIANHLNIPKPPAGQPTLMTYDEVVTAFHEFGHALHGMFSNVEYPRFSGTSVPRDFVEFPSQVNEMWVAWPEILTRYARRHETGEPMPPELVEKVQAAQRFNQGYKTTEYLAASTSWIRHGIRSPRMRRPRRPTSWRLKGRRWNAAAWPLIPCRRGTGARTSPTSSKATVTRRGITRTSGPRCWTRTRWSGSRRTAA